MKLVLRSALCSLALAGAAQAQSTVFTYQGRLRNGPALASGPHDMRFRLFTAESGGSPVGSPLCRDNVAVSQGLFTAPLDFGQAFTTSVPRFLEVEVRADSGLDCLDSSGFTVLAPRQLITAAPLALQAKRATALSAPDGNPADAVFVDSAGKVGIGTAVPVTPLHVTAPEPVLTLQDSDNVTSQVGYIGFANAASVETGYVGFGSSANAVFHIANNRSSGHIAMLPTGNVGVGTTAPAGKLDVRGDIRFGPAGEYRAVGGTANIHIVRGTVNSAGTKIAGEGFTSSRAGTGDYVITFLTPFGFRPVVTATCEWESGLSAGLATTDVVTTTSMNIVIVNPSTNSLANREFSFIAIGNN